MLRLMPTTREMLFGHLIRRPSLMELVRSLYTVTPHDHMNSVCIVWFNRDVDCGWIVGCSMLLLLAAIKIFMSHVLLIFSKWPDGLVV
jgi:hypothetical protein